MLSNDVAIVCDELITDLGSGKAEQAKEDDEISHDDPGDDLVFHMIVASLYTLQSFAHMLVFSISVVYTISISDTLTIQLKRW